MSNIVYATTIVSVECGVCHVPFGLSKSFYDKVVGDGTSFYCPNGHKISYYETDLKRAKRELEAANARLVAARAETDRQRAAARHQESRAASYKGQVTKIKKRVSKGVCPCCNRSFVNLANHMAGQHPDFDPDKAAQKSSKTTKKRR